MPNLNELIGTVTRTFDRVLHENPSSLALLGDFESVLKALKLNSGQLLSVQESVTVFKNPVLEQAISIETRIKDLSEEFVVIQVTGHQSGEKSFESEQTWSVIT
ncbi:MAG: hypothetical protein WCK49_05420 [Myxococcaceae bacterium]